MGAICRFIAVSLYRSSSSSVYAYLRVFASIRTRVTYTFSHFPGTRHRTVVTGVLLPFALSRLPPDLATSLLPSHGFRFPRSLSDRTIPSRTGPIFRDTTQRERLSIVWNGLLAARGTTLNVLPLSIAWNHSRRINISYYTHGTVWRRAKRRERRAERNGEPRAGQTAESWSRGSGLPYNDRVA